MQLSIYFDGFRWIYGFWSTRPPETLHLPGAIDNQNKRDTNSVIVPTQDQARIYRTKFMQFTGMIRPFPVTDRKGANTARSFLTPVNQT